MFIIGPSRALINTKNKILPIIPKLFQNLLFKLPLDVMSKYKQRLLTKL